MFYNLLIWLFTKPKGRAAKPSAVHELAYIGVMIFILSLLSSCHG